MAGSQLCCALDKLEHKSDVKLLQTSKNDNQSFQNDLLSIIKENYLSFNCSNCGYSSKSYIWQCPSCNSWETIEPSTISDRVTIDG